MFKNDKYLYADMDVEHCLRNISHICRQIDNFIDMIDDEHVVTPYTMEGIDNGVSQIIEIMCKLKIRYYADGVAKDNTDQQ